MQLYKPPFFAGSPWIDVNNPPIMLNRLLMTEYCRRGTLEKALIAAAGVRKPINDRTLWLIFDCRMCSIPMGIPPPGAGRYTSRSANVSSVLQMVVAMQFRQEQWSDDGPHLIGREERIPTKEQMEDPRLSSYHFVDPDDWIHFDIDPGNSKALSILSMPYVSRQQLSHHLSHAEVWIANPSLISW